MYFYADFNARNAGNLPALLVSPLCQQVGGVPKRKPYKDTGKMPVLLQDRARRPETQARCLCYCKTGRDARSHRQDACATAKPGATPGATGKMPVLLLDFRIAFQSGQGFFDLMVRQFIVGKLAGEIFFIACKIHQSVS